jgi:hypothetical protein
MKKFFVAALMVILAPLNAQAQQSFFCSYWSGAELVTMVRNQPNAVQLFIEAFGQDAFGAAVLLDTTTWDYPANTTAEFRWTPNLNPAFGPCYYIQNNQGYSGWIVCPSPLTLDGPLNKNATCHIKTLDFESGMLPPSCGGGVYGDC